MMSCLISVIVNCIIGDHIELYWWVGNLSILVMTNWYINILSLLLVLVLVMVLNDGRLGCLGRARRQSQWALGTGDHCSEPSWSIAGDMAVVMMMVEEKMVVVVSLDGLMVIPMIRRHWWPLFWTLVVDLKTVELWWRCWIVKIRTNTHFVHSGPHAVLLRIQTFFAKIYCHIFWEIQIHCLFHSFVCCTSTPSMGFVSGVKLLHGVFSVAQFSSRCSKWSQIELLSFDIRCFTVKNLNMESLEYGTTDLVQVEILAPGIRCYTASAL